MVQYLIVPACVILKFSFERFFCVSWLLFDPLLALAVVYAFLHSLETRECVVYALWCGLWRDLSSMDIFGLYMMSYVLTVLGAVYLSRIVWRHNWHFIFPLTFIAVFFNIQMIWVLNGVLGGRSGGYLFILLVRAFAACLETVLLAYPFYLLLKRCAPESTS